MFSKNWLCNAIFIIYGDLLTEFYSLMLSVVILVLFVILYNIKRQSLAFYDIQSEVLFIENCYAFESDADFI